MARILVIGYGNPGRLDDGLGPALAQAVDRLGIAGVDVDSDYQLTVEDAHELAHHDVVIFADADVSGPEPFYLKTVAPAPRVTFSSHSIGPASLLGLTRELFAACPQAFILGIRGYEFNEYEERLSAKAQENLEQAVTFMETALRTRSFTEIRADQVEASRDTETVDE